MDLSSQWIVGLVDGTGSFHISVKPGPETTASQVSAEFMIVLPKREVQILFALKTFFKCGVVKSDQNDTMTFRVRKPEHLLTSIIPFFMKHELKSKKRIEFEKFRDVLLMMDRKEQLTADDLEKIRATEKWMNTKAG